MEESDRGCSSLPQVMMEKTVLSLQPGPLEQMMSNRRKSRTDPTLVMTASIQRPTKTKGGEAALIRDFLHSMAHSRESEIFRSGPALTAPSIPETLPHALAIKTPQDLRS